MTGAKTPARLGDHQMAGRIYAVLHDGGWTEYHPGAEVRYAQFTIATGVGSTVQVSWKHASDEQRMVVLTAMFGLLVMARIPAQLRNTPRGDHIYVPRVQEQET